MRVCGCDPKVAAQAGRDDAVKADDRGTGKRILPFAGTGILLFQVQAE